MRDAAYTALVDVEGGIILDVALIHFVRAIRPLPDGEYILSLTPGSEAALRSLQQNKYQWKLFELIGAECGLDKNDVHDLMCAKFLTHAVEVVDRQTGEITSTPTVKGTSRLTRAEHAQFLNEVILWASEWLGMTLPGKPE